MGNGYSAWIIKNVCKKLGDTKLHYSFGCYIQMIEKFVLVVVLLPDGKCCSDLTDLIGYRQILTEARNARKRATTLTHSDLTVLDRV